MSALDEMEERNERLAYERGLADGAKQEPEYRITESELKEYARLKAHKNSADFARLSKVHELSEKYESEIRSRGLIQQTGNIGQCKECIFVGLRGCMYHGYPENTIPPYCSFKIGIHSVLPNVEAQFHNQKQYDAALREDGARQERERMLDAFSHALQKKTFFNGTTWCVSNSDIDEVFESLRGHEGGQ